MNIIFLDIDGVFNCETFYEKRFAAMKRYDGIPLYKQVKKMLRRFVKNNTIRDKVYYRSQICSERMEWFNELCRDVNAKVVISSTWRMGRTVEELRELLKMCGATFEIIDKTPRTGYERGTDISKWLKDNIKPETHGCHYYDFNSYVIIDDDSDMLLNQQNHFFKTDNYSGLTPNTCYKIKRFFTNKMFTKEN